LWKDQLVQLLKETERSQ